ncbi:hypothetical protein Patl1_30254 [Pistacia atlantica]|uniref:Uncharacterized protein n=1 Tax=Pistacia atlantica TaxID=434234 RepID=A0ACC1ABS8_9ROSI|nr:hypothetical protein Patl1_30254 [Pistacia atlantica]
MATTLSKDSSPNPAWFTPKRSLEIVQLRAITDFISQAMVSMGVSGRVMAKEYALPVAGFNPYISFIAYGKFSSKLNFKATGRGDFNLKNFQDGVLSAAFMVGLLVASPIFASLAKR